MLSTLIFLLTFFLNSSLIGISPTFNESNFEIRICVGSECYDYIDDIVALWKIYYRNHQNIDLSKKVIQEKIQKICSDPTSFVAMVFHHDTLIAVIIGYAFINASMSNDIISNVVEDMHLASKFYFHTGVAVALEYEKERKYLENVLLRKQELFAQSRGYKGICCIDQEVNKEIDAYTALEYKKFGITINNTWLVDSVKNQSMHFWIKEFVRGRDNPICY